MTKSSSFWDKVSQKYSQSPIKDMAAYEKTLERTRSHLTETDKVLEIGCGTGSTALLLATSAGTYLATDFSEGMIGIAKEKQTGDTPTNLSFLQAGLQDSRLEAASFDKVLAYSLLHLLEDLPGDLDRINALLKPGGLLISKTVCLSGVYSLFRLIIPIMQLFGKAPYVRFMTPEALEAEISAHGFEIVESGTHSGKRLSWFVVARKTG